MSNVVGAIMAQRVLYGNIKEKELSFFDKIFLDMEMNGYKYCECGSVLEHYNIENPLYQNDNIGDSMLPPTDLRSTNEVEIKDEEIISKLQLNFLENEKCKKLISYIKNSYNKDKEYLSYADCKECNQIYSKISRRIKMFCGIKYSDNIIYNKIE